MSDPQPEQEQSTRTEAPIQKPEPTPPPPGAPPRIVVYGGKEHGAASRLFALMGMFCSISGCILVSILEYSLPVFIVTGIFIAIGLVLARYSRTLEKEAQQLKNAPIIRATVVDRWEDTDSDNDLCHFITYQFEARLPGGKTKKVFRSVSISSNLYDRLSIGARVPVRYLPDKPHIVYLEESAL